VRSFSHWILTVCASPAGVVVLAALDSTLFFSFPLGIDAVVIILAARLHDTAWIVPLLATAGSTAGAALTFWMGVEIGEHGLERYVAPDRLKKVHAKVKTSGAVALAVLDLIPPPFPFTPFVLAAGALEVRPTTFFVTLAVCRLGRFGAEALFARRYGRRIVGWMNSPLLNDLVIGFAVLALLLTVVSLIKFFKTSGRPRARRAPA
jgi:membrane protein YqaA with SNARE-associated domain